MINLLSKASYRVKEVYPFICQLGTGGNGTYVLQQLAQLLSILEKDALYLVADPDVVEKKNLKNQLFVKSDIGKKKADVLAKRYSAAYDFRIASYSESYIEDVEALNSLFNKEYLSTGSRYDVMYLPVIIGCVDNNYTRQVMHEFFKRSSRCLYIDVGCDAAKVPKDFGTRPMNEWTKEELSVYNESGWDGQVVCGLKLGGETILPPVGEVFPEILNDIDEIAPSQLACSNVVASDPQRVLCNRMAAMSVAPYLNDLLSDGIITNHMTVFHAKKGYMKSMPYMAK